MARATLEIRLESDDFDCGAIQVHALTGHEAISSLFSFDVHVACLDGDALEPAELEGALASLVFEHGGAEVRRVHGMIAEVEEHFETEVETRLLRLRLVPRAHRLTLIQTQEIFMNLGVPEIIRKKLELVGLDGPDDFELRLHGKYPKREFVVQYRETDLAFLSRLTEHLGIGFFFEHADGADKIVFTDTPGGFRPVPGCESAPFAPRGDHRDVYALSATTRMIPKSYLCHDYNYRTPLVDVSGTAKASSGLAGGVVEYGVHAKTPKEAATIARVRAEEAEARHRVFSGKSALAALSAGGRFVLEGHARLGDVDLLVTSLRHEAKLSTGMHGGGDGERTYVNAFDAIDATIPYRPPVVTPKPRIHGVVTGIVEPMMPGDETRFAKIDHHGRYVVRFLFDTAPPGERKASRPVRMLQAHAGPGYGSHFPLKPGVEVLMTFLDGDPDRPLIVGAAPNAVTPSPVTRKNQLTHRIVTETGIHLTMKDG